MGIFKNKKILVTGGTGSIGSELVKYLLKFESPAVVRVLDINESQMFDLQNELEAYNNVRFLLGDIRDKNRLVRAMEGIDYVFHTAAYKHVLFCEYNPFEAVKTNVVGIQNLIDVCLDYKVKKVIFTSSDKAVNPCNTMGATKLLCERLMISANYYGAEKSIFASVRFGNVLDTKGSVIPLFKKQIQSGGPLTITNTEMTRFMMSKSDAVQLTLKSMELARGGEIFIFKMPVLRIMDVAQVLIEKTSLKKKIDIKIIGNKPGESIYEELMTEDEANRAFETDELFIVLPEIKEIYPINPDVYAGAHPAKPMSYSSKDINPLSKDEVEDLLRMEKIV